MNISKAKVIDLLDKAGKEFDKTQFVFNDSCDDKYAQVWITPLKDWTSRWQNPGLCLPEDFQTVSDENF